jgi:glutamine synthetase
LLHEKPFKGVNGSGKHNNWSLGTDTGVQLFAPGKTPLSNLQFITFVANVMAAVHKYNGLLKASIISATNQHRLGANEAPPAIISIFLGKQIGELVNKIIQSPNKDVLNISTKSGLDLHVFQVPELLLDNTDRNRTSPFAFTGNRFEFRALGSSANCASAMIAINAAVACQLMEFKEQVDMRIARGENKENTIFAEVQKLLIESQPIHFDGNGYSEEWRKEAARRGLDCEASAPLMYDSYLTPEVVKMFEKTGVMTEAELLARNEVKWELYTKKIQIEARVLGDIVMNHIIPVATRYQSLLIDNVFKIKNLFPAEKVEAIAAQDMAEIEKIALHMLTIKEKANAMVEARKVANLIEDERAKAIAYRETVEPYMEEIRYHVDKLELMIDNEIWPLPKYRELLFIK